MSKPTELHLERRHQENETLNVGPVSLMPFNDEDYWQYRVRLSESQAVLGFPKYSTIGIGFAREEDWNTNLPYTCSTDMIFDHILHNKADERIPDEDVRSAIELIQRAATADRAAVE
jgi:hypothetical protein